MTKPVQTYEAMRDALAKKGISLNTFTVDPKNVINRFVHYNIIIDNIFITSTSCREMIIRYFNIYINLTRIKETGLRIENHTYRVYVKELFIKPYDKEKSKVELFINVKNKDFKNIVSIREIERYMGVNEKELTTIEYFRQESSACSTFKFNPSSFWLTSSVHLSLFLSMVKSHYWGVKGEIFKSLEVILRASDFVFSDPKLNWPVDISPTYKKGQEQIYGIGSLNGTGCYTFSKVALGLNKGMSNFLINETNISKLLELKKNEPWVSQREETIKTVKSILRNQQEKHVLVG